MKKLMYLFIILIGSIIIQSYTFPFKIEKQVAKDSSSINIYVKDIKVDNKFDDVTVAKINELISSSVDLNNIKMLYMKSLLEPGLTDEEEVIMNSCTKYNIPEEQLKLKNNKILGIKLWTHWCIILSLIGIYCIILYQSIRKFWSISYAVFIASMVSLIVLLAYYNLPEIIVYCVDKNYYQFLEYIKLFKN